MNVQLVGQIEGQIEGHMDSRTCNDQPRQNLRQQTCAVEAKSVPHHRRRTRCWVAC